jgi:class 3 adenylate cyclase
VVAGFDPEDLREDLRAYQNAVSAVVARYDGFVAKFMGDGVLAYLGYPRAHEDDAERRPNSEKRDVLAAAFGVVAVTASPPARRGCRATCRLGRSAGRRRRSCSGPAHSDHERGSVSCP